MNKKHGHTRVGHHTKIYGVWCAMKCRCYNKRFKYYADYGGRGITVCTRWHKFENFLDDMGTPRIGETLERKDNNGDYTPTNCVWATRKEQCRNRRSNITLELNGKKKIIADWVSTTHINFATLRRRMKLGWSNEKILTTPTAKVAKLNSSKADKIRSLLAEGGTPKDIAATFGVSRAVVYDIKHYRTWKV